MEFVTQLFRRIVAAFRRDRIVRELDEEFEFHVRMKADARRRQGVSPEEAYK